VGEAHDKHLTDLPGSVLFSCDFNAVRSPMAEGLLKHYYGTEIFIQSAGVREGLNLDGFSISVMQELGIDIHRHQPRTFEAMEAYGEDFGAYDVIIALSPASMRRAQEYTRHNSIEVHYWPTFDPTDTVGSREQRLLAYRQTRDQIADRITALFGANKPR